MPQTAIHSIAQTADGYLWAATLDVLIRIDGVKFTVFNKQNTKDIISNELVFPNSTSRQREISVKTAVKEAVKRLGVSKITVNDLRRTAASRLLDAGIDHITIASILGNTDLRMILRYAQSSKAKRKAVKLLEKQNRRTARRATARRKQREKNGVCFARPDEQIARSFLIGKTIRKLISRSKQFAQSG